MRSVIGRQLNAFTDAIDAGIQIATDLHHAQRKKTFLSMITDSKNNFHIITVSKGETENKLTIIVGAAQQALKTFAIDYVRPITGEENPVNEITELKPLFSNGL